MRCICQYNLARFHISESGLVHNQNCIRRGRMKAIEKELQETNSTKNNKLFLKKLSQWIIKHYGNVNVAQRLNVINIKRFK